MIYYLISFKNILKEFFGNPSKSYFVDMLSLFPFCSNLVNRSFLEDQKSFVLNNKMSYAYMMLRCDKGYENA